MDGNPSYIEAQQSLSLQLELWANNSRQSSYLTNLAVSVDVEDTGYFCLEVQWLLSLLCYEERKDRKQ